MVEVARIRFARRVRHDVPAAVPLAVVPRDLRQRLAVEPVPVVEIADRDDVVAVAEHLAMVRGDHGLALKRRE
jgi:hypothetical protein